MSDDFFSLTTIFGLIDSTCHCHIRNVFVPKSLKFVALQPVFLYFFRNLGLAFIAFSLGT